MTITPVEGTPISSAAAEPSPVHAADVGREAAHEGNGPPEGSGPREHVTDLEDNQQHRGPLRIITQTAKDSANMTAHQTAKTTAADRATDSANV